MSRGWKPGDVASIRVGTGDWEYGIRREDGTWGCQHTLNGLHENDVQATPLAVIDPEDREAVERLANAYASATHADFNDYPMSVPALHMQAALREFANPKPPRPDEPQGLGAVVEDAEGLRWVAIGEFKRPDATRWRQEFGAASGVKGKFSDIDAVRVLSEGVQP